jgi:hypothetical protein
MNPMHCYNPAVTGLGIGFMGEENNLPWLLGFFFAAKGYILGSIYPKGGPVLALFWRRSIGLHVEFTFELGIRQRRHGMNP